MEDPAKHALVAHNAPDPTPMALVATALNNGAPIEVMERLAALAERFEAAKAKRDFDAAFAKFKAECPPVQRRTENTQFTATKDGRKVARKYASLEDIEATTRPHLGANGLSYSWESAIIDDKNRLTMPCIVSHVGGGSRVSSATVPLESKAGCSEQQKFGAAMAYAQRFSLIAALGLTSCEEDTDGRDDTEEAVKGDGLAEIRRLYEAAKSNINEDSFWEYVGCDGFERIPASMYAEVVALLRKKASK